MDSRQKTYAIFIRPYVMYTDTNQNTDRLVQRGALYVKSPGQNSGTAYTAVSDGDGWVLYKNKYINSWEILQETQKEIMDTLGYSINDINVTIVIPTDHVITPTV